MNEEKLKKNITILAVLGLILVCGAIVFTFFQKDARNWDSMMPQEEENSQEEIFTPYSKNDSEEEVEYKFNKETLTSIYVSCVSDDPLEDCYFEYKIDDGKLFFTSHYATEEKDYNFESLEINIARMEEAYKVINRYNVTKAINDYRSGGKLNSVEYVPEEGSDIKSKKLVFGWIDGDSADMGYPNGVGDALIRYFKEIAVWVCENK